MKNHQNHTSALGALGGVLLSTGLLFVLIVFLPLSCNQRFYELTEHVEGRFSGCHEGKAVIKYQIGTKKYTGYLELLDSSLKPGDWVPLCYQAEAPEQIRTKAAQSFTWGFLGLGVFLFLAGFCTAVWDFITRRFNWR